MDLELAETNRSPLRSCQGVWEEAQSLQDGVILQLWVSRSQWRQVGSHLLIQATEKSPLLPFQKLLFQIPEHFQWAAGGLSSQCGNQECSEEAIQALYQQRVLLRLKDSQVHVAEAHVEWSPLHQKLWQIS